MKTHAFSIYNASAGSGKTFTLVKEYLKILLLSPYSDAYRSILAITFTNKAVNEMKSRVTYHLRQFTKDVPSDKSEILMQTIAVESGLSLIQIKEKAAAIIKTLIHNYAAFDIETIDKFTHKVIRAFAHDLKIPVNFEVTLDTQLLLNQAVDKIISMAGDDHEITKLLVDYTLQKTNEDKSWDITKEITETGSLLLNENHKNELKRFEEITIQDFVDVKSELEKRIASLSDETVQEANKILQLLEDSGIDLASFRGGYFPKHIQSIAASRFNPALKMYFVPTDVGINKNAPDGATIESVLPTVLTILDSIYKRFEKIRFYEAIGKNLIPLSLINLVRKELTFIQEEQNILSISEFNQLINDQIQQQPAPFIYERLGEKHKHFFIDEFQDTSVMQWQNLVPLIDNALAGQDLDGQKGSLLIVGDPKQSIYRWRGGKAEQFIALTKCSNPFSNPDKKLFSLDTNRRSYSQIVHFNNDLFQFLSGKFQDEDYKQLYQNDSFQNTNDKTGGYVSIQFISKENREEDDEDQTVSPHYLHEIRSAIDTVLAKGFAFKDIVILTRNNKNAVLTANYLITENIPVISSESLLLEASSEVQNIIHILRYMNNGYDMEAKAGFLYYLAETTTNSKQRHDFIASGISKNDEALRAWLNDYGIVLNFASLRRKSLYEAVEDIIAGTIKTENRHAYLQYFLDVILEKDIRNQFGISEFLSYWDTKGNTLSIPLPEDNNAIRILTIHKSKGLEFPVVIFPFAEENFSRSPKEKMWLDTNDEAISLPSALVPFTKSVSSYGEQHAKLYFQKREEQLLDAINVLYVALTRAEEQLYIITAVTDLRKDGSYPDNLAAWFREYLTYKGTYNEDCFLYEFGNAQRQSPEKPPGNIPLPVPQRYSETDKKSIKIARRESLMWNTKQQKAIEFGTLVHEILSYIKTANDLDLALIKAVENGLIAAEASEEVRQTVNKILTHPEVASHFAPNLEVFNEKTILRKNHTALKPDRVAVNKKGEAFLLDYKTGEYLDKHKTQVLQYKSVLEELGYSVVKSSLLYIGENSKVLHL